MGDWSGMKYMFNIYQASTTSRSHPVLSIELIVIHIEMCIRGVWCTPGFCNYNSSGLMNCAEQSKLLHFICETPSVNNRNFGRLVQRCNVCVIVWVIMKIISKCERRNFSGSSEVIWLKLFSATYAKKGRRCVLAGIGVVIWCRRLR